MAEPRTDQPSRESGPLHDLIEINHGAFQALLLVFLALLLVEGLRRGTVTDFFNLNWLLLLVVVTGLIAGLAAREEPQPSEPPRVRRRDVALVVFLALASWLVLWYEFQDLGWIQYPVPILGGLLVGTISLSLLLPEGPQAPVPNPDVPGAPGIPRRARGRKTRGHAGGRPLLVAPKEEPRGYIIPAVNPPSVEFPGPTRAPVSLVGRARSGLPGVRPSPSDHESSRVRQPTCGNCGRSIPAVNKAGKPYLRCPHCKKALGPAPA